MPIQKMDGWKILAYEKHCSTLIRVLGSEIEKRNGKEKQTCPDDKGREDREFGRFPIAGGVVVREFSATLGTLAGRAIALPGVAHEQPGLMEDQEGQ